MAEKFRNHVHVTDPETGQVLRFAPGDTVPKSLEDLVDPANFESSAGKSEAAAKVNYHTLKKDELADLCAERGLDFEGTKDDMIGRLEESDAALS